MAETGAPVADAETIDPVIAQFAQALQAGYAAYPDLEHRPLPERRAIAEAVRAPWRTGGPAKATPRELLAATPGGPPRGRLLLPTAQARPPGAPVPAPRGGLTRF